ncbi:MAG: cysteine hydrolase family protein [Lachnospiraceae bacterium]
MGKKYLIVVDMQNDFVTGVLGSKEAQQIVSNVVEKVKRFDGEVLFTRDTHGENYNETQEGKCLPVKHCVKGSVGWQLIPQLEEYRTQKQAIVYDKPSFGSVELAHDMAKKADEIESVELIGVCTDICVVSNALLLKAVLPEIPVKVDASCCAGVTVEKHQAALETMKSCQVIVEEE